VCGVFDDAVKLEEGKRLGNYGVIAESLVVRHVGAAMVVSDSRRVAPLFVAVTIRDRASVKKFWPTPRNIAKREREEKRTAQRMKRKGAHRNQQQGLQWRICWSQHIYAHRRGRWLLGMGIDFL